MIWHNMWLLFPELKSPGVVIDPHVREILGQIFLRPTNRVDSPPAIQCFPSAPTLVVPGPCHGKDLDFWYNHRYATLEHRRQREYLNMRRPMTKISW